MANIDFRRIWLNNKLIGFVAQDTNGKVFVKGIDENATRTLKSFVAPVNIELTDNEGELSISSSRLVKTSDKGWISAMEFGIPAEYFASIVETTTMTKFNKMEP